MKAKVLLALSAAMLALMLTLAMSPERADCENLLLITTRGHGVGGLGLEKVGEICADEFLLTYEIPQNTEVKSLNLSGQARLVGTNSAFPYVTGYNLTGGGFFTKSAWDSESRHAVFNEAAAFSFFGSRDISGMTFRINGETWLAVGVIQDNDEENLNIYVPSSVTGGQARSFMAMMDQKNGIGEAYIVNGLQSLGLRDSESEYVNLSRAADGYWERFWVSVWISVCLAAILLFKTDIKWIAGRLSEYKSLLRRVYLMELVSDSRAELAKMAAAILVLPTCGWVVVYFAPKILETCMKWQDISLPTGAATDFAGNQAWIYNHQTIGLTVFAAFLLTSAWVFILAWQGLARIWNKLGADISAG